MRRSCSWPRPSGSPGSPSACATTNTAARPTATTTGCGCRPVSAVTSGGSGASPPGLGAAPRRRAPWLRAPAADAAGRRAIRRWPWQLVAGVAVLVVLAGLAIAAPLFGSPTHQDLTHGLGPTGLPVRPGPGYPPGARLLGRNALGRVGCGSRVSLLVALVPNATAI